MTDRLKGLDLIDRVPEELWMEVHDVVPEAVIKIIPKGKKNGKRQNGCLRRPFQICLYFNFLTLQYCIGFAIY